MSDQDHSPPRIRHHQPKKQSRDVGTGALIANPIRTSDEVTIQERQQEAEIQLHAFDERFVDEASVSISNDHAAEDASNMSPEEFLASAIFFSPWLGFPAEEIDLCASQVSARHLQVEDV